MPPSTRPPSCFIALWLFVWTVGVLAFDGVLGWALFHQLRAATFPTTDGIITRSGIKHDGEDTHRLVIAYTYTVAGQGYTGTRYSFGEIATNASTWEKVSAELPVGSLVRVSYNPSDPAEAVLRPGFTGFHLMMLWFLTPFNVVLVAGWVYALRSRRPEFGPHSLTRTANGWRVRTPGIGRAGCFGVVLLVVTFAGSFAWGFGFGFNPPPQYAGSAYCAVVALAVFASRLIGPSTFEVDEVARVLRFPAELPFAAVREVVITRGEVREVGDPDRYECALANEGGAPVRVATYSERESAEALVAWLRERLAGAPA